jgi:hypothetical protein
LPDKILNIDYLTKKRLKKIGIKEKKIKTVGHPYFEQVENGFRLKKNKNFYLFISQPITKWTQKKFKLKSNFFYNKYLQLKSKNKNKIIYVIHPHEDKKVLKKKIKFIKYLKKNFLEESSGIIGYYSTVIMTALLLNKPIYLIKKNNEFLNKEFLDYYNCKNNIFYNFFKFEKFVRESKNKRKKLYFKNSTKKIYNLLIN